MIYKEMEANPQYVMVTVDYEMRGKEVVNFYTRCILVGKNPPDKILDITEGSVF